MRRDLLLIVLGIDIGTAAPDLAIMANSLLGGDLEGIMAELGIAWQSFVIEAVIAFIIILILHRIGKKERAEKDEIKKASLDNTQRIIDAIQEKS